MIQTITWLLPLTLTLPTNEITLHYIHSHLGYRQLKILELAINLALFTKFKRYIYRTHDGVTVVIDEVGLFPKS